MDFHQLIIDYGYLALFIGTFLEGETILVVAGFLAHGGYLELPWVIVAAFSGTFAGDQTFFYLGRFKGIRFLEKRPLWHSKTDKVFDLLHRHQIKVVLGFRFLYGVQVFRFKLSGRVDLGHRCWLSWLSVWGHC
jgi:membrane protein DedA with SNARE-associated domain